MRCSGLSHACTFRGRLRHNRAGRTGAWWRARTRGRSNNFRVFYDFRHTCEVREVWRRLQYVAVGGVAISGGRWTSGRWGRTEGGSAAQVPGGRETYEEESGGECHWKRWRGVKAGGRLRGDARGTLGVSHHACDKRSTFTHDNANRRGCASLPSRTYGPTK